MSENLTEVDWKVLEALEDEEQELINFGIYETHLTPEVVERRLAASGTDPTPRAVRDSLERLCRERWALPASPGRFRSRIAEIVRLLKNVKQRFSPGDAAYAPLLIQAVRVEFANRRRLQRVHAASEAFAELFRRHRDRGLPKWDTARRVVLEAAAAAVGLAPAEFRLTGVQRRALLEIGGAYARRIGGGFVVTGNTGSGKTEAVLYPLLVGALQERFADKTGCKVILVYPRQALARNQLERLVQYLARLNAKLATLPGMGVASNTLSVGILFGETPEDDRELAAGSQYRRAWENRGAARVVPYFTTEDGGPVVAECERPGRYRLRPAAGPHEWTLEGFRATRHSIRESPPDVLVVTTEMLHRWLSDPSANDLFGVASAARAANFCPPRAVVFDEIHLYDSTHGAQIAGVLRRFRHRLNRTLAAEGAGWKHPLVVGMSATIADAAGFWKSLSGVPVATPIEPVDADFGHSQGRDYFLFLRPETFSRGRPVGDASTAIQAIMTIAHNMPRRAGAADAPPKHRSLVFLDSIGKVRKLTVEFRDAESKLGLALLRTTPPQDGLASAEFADGEYWHFEHADSAQFNEKRAPGSPPTPLTSSDQPVYSATGRLAADALARDVVFATTSLEVGYDDSSIQFVFQHHAPRNAASFVQKRGRAGRSPHDRPITAVTLSRRQFKDAFYFASPRRLYDPADYRPALNADNYFVQRFQTLCLVFDEIARATGRDFRRVESNRSPEEHGRLLDRVLRDADLGRALDAAYAHVAAPGFRRVAPGWRDAWRWFRRELARSPATLGSGDALSLVPTLPRNLFGTVNLPTVQVAFPAGEEWDDAQEDVALVLGETAPGRVTRRYGRPWEHRLHWRAPGARVQDGPSSGTRWGDFAVERYRSRTDGFGPFDPARLEPLSNLWGDDWEKHFPERARRLYPGGLPARFYRIHSVELHDFGTVDPDDPRKPQPDWRWLGVRESGGVRLRYDADGSFRKRTPAARQVSADSNSFPLAFAVVRAIDPERRRVCAAAATAPLPPFFRGLADLVEGFCGDADGERSVLHVHEAYFGAEATIKLIPQRPDDPDAGPVSMDVRYVSEHDGEPVLYGHDITAEGVRVAYDPRALATSAERLKERVLADATLAVHYQDQFFRYLLKTRPWPVEAATEPLSVFDARALADLLATARAETRAHGRTPDEFVDAVTAAGGLWPLVSPYWRDHRLIADRDFVARCDAALAGARARTHLLGLIQEVRRDFRRFLSDVVLHSLEQGLRNLFLVEGSAREEEVGTHAVLWATHRREADDPAVYVYERNQDGNGATRLLMDGLRRGDGHAVRRWWACSCGCPVAEEEDFAKYVLRNHAEELRAFAVEHRAAPDRDKPSPRPLLKKLSAAYGAAWEEAAGVARLAGLLTGTLTFAGVEIPSFELTQELAGLESELAGRFGRPPIGAELAGFACSRAETRPDASPNLAALLALYRDHAQNLGWDPTDESASANPTDRFLSQVEALALLGCVDACPACLAGRSAHGPMEVTRHLVSRRLLEAASEISMERFTRPARGESAESLTAVAREGGWLVLEGTERPTSDLTRELADAGLDQLAEIVVFPTNGPARFRGLWRARASQ